MGHSTLHPYRLYDIEWDDPAMPDEVTIMLPEWLVYSPEYDQDDPAWDAEVEKALIAKFGMTPDGYSMEPDEDYEEPEGGGN
jgi:hypothetical protein